MARNGTALNATCNPFVEIPMFMGENRRSIHATYTTVTVEELIEFNPEHILPEIILYTLAFLLAACKSIFSFGFTLAIIYPSGMQVLLYENFEGAYYLAHACVYFGLVVFSVINTIMMFVNRMEANFFDKPENLRVYSVLNALGICLHIGIYFLYIFVNRSDLTSKLIGEIMGFVLLLDMFVAGCFLIYECILRAKIHNSRSVLQGNLNATENETHPFHV